MPSTAERTPREKETLIFATPEEAQRWRESVGEQLRAPQTEGVHRQKDIVGQAVAKQFEQTGEGVGVIRHPWEHTPQEHEEAQHLVDIAFSKDLWAAVKQARSSPHYPRNLDLFHDVLTNELYEGLREHGLQKQSVIPAALGAAIVLAVGLLLAIVVIFFALQ
jgi:hypothetical protein